MSGLSGPATLGRRVGAYAIDTAVAVLISAAAAGILAGVSLATGGAFPLVAAVAVAYAITGGWFFVYTWMQGRAGSIGMRALGLRLARAADGVAQRTDAPLGFGRALGRNVVWGLGSVIVVGMFSPLFDSSPWRRGWHDRASGAVMTDVAGRGAPFAEPAGEVFGAVAPRPASAPPVLPAAPILPKMDGPEFEGWSPGGQSVPAPARVEAGVISFVPGVSDPARATAAPEPVERSMAAPGIPTALGFTALEDPLEATRLSGDRPLARLVWDDGGRQALYERTIFGRNPIPETGAMVSPVRDETLSLSKTHFELVPDEDRILWVIDRHSTNGVVVRRGTQRQQAAPGERTRVRMGDVLEFGDRHVLIEVAP